MNPRETASGGGSRGAVRALVLMSETYADGGIQRFNRTFLTACDLLGVQCEVLSLGDAAAARSRWCAPPCVKISVYNHHKARFALATAVRVLRGGYDFIIIGHINLLQMAIAITKLRRSGRVLLIAHGIEVWTGVKGSRRVALRSVDSTLCVSRYTQQSIQSQAPELSDSRFVIFPNALSESWRALPASSSADWRSARLPERFLLSVTRLDRGDRQKGIVTVLEALKMNQDPSIHYVIAGRGNDLAFIQGVVQRLGLGERVRFLGSVSDAELAILYRKCVAFVLPSGKEGFGIVFLEAMFFGACVIAAREKGALDVVKDGDTGILVPYGDCVALKHAIDRVVADPALRRRLATAGRATVVDDGEFTFKSYVRRLARILNVAPPETEDRIQTSPDSRVTKEPVF